MCASHLTHGSLVFYFGQRLKWMIILIFFSVVGFCSFLFLLITGKCVTERAFFDSVNQPLFERKDSGSAFFGLDPSSPSMQATSNPNVYTKTFKSLPHMNAMPYDGFSRRRELSQAPPSLTQTQPSTDTRATNRWDNDDWTSSKTSTDYDNE